MSPDDIEVGEVVSKIKKPVCYVPLGCTCLGLVIFIIILLASLHELGPKEQLLVKDPSGHWVRNGPWHGLVITHHSKEVRKATLLQPEEYAVVKSQISGDITHKPGPDLVFLGPYDELKYVRPKIVTLKDQYVLLQDQVTGAERILVGPQSITPKPLEIAPHGVQQARFLEVETALLIQDRETGKQRLVTETGVFIPSAYEEIVEERKKIHILPHEAVAVRDPHGEVIFYSGGEGNGEGTAFFLLPYHRIVEMHWSNFSQPPEQQSSSKVVVTKVDMRARQMFFRYEVRTSDNVKLLLEGSIFWQVKSLRALINATADPEGDVWHHARSALIGAVSNVTLQRFMSGFNSIVMEAFGQQAQDNFYSERGVELHSMEVTGFDCVDEKTRLILQEIIQETTNRINRLTAQESENEVRAAAMAADIHLEQQRTELIRTRAENERLQLETRGEADGMQRVRSANAFIGGLNQSVPEITSRVELYKMHEQLNSRNTDTHNLASGTAHLFVTPQDLDLRLHTGTGPSASADLQEL